jgi:hypothetical protein
MLKRNEGTITDERSAHFSCVPGGSFNQENTCGPCCRDYEDWLDQSRYRDEEGNDDCDLIERMMDNRGMPGHRTPIDASYVGHHEIEKCGDERDGQE